MGQTATNWKSLELQMVVLLHGGYVRILGCYGLRPKPWVSNIPLAVVGGKRDTNIRLQLNFNKGMGYARQLDIPLYILVTVTDLNMIL